MHWKGITLAQVRSAASFVLGVLIIIHQTVVGTNTTERPLLLAVACGLIGVPVFQHLESKNGST